MYRIETDSKGDFKVPIDAYYGIQTERSKKNFNIASETDKMPSLIIKSLIMLKLSAAEANAQLKLLEPELMKLIFDAAVECLNNFTKWQTEFPLVVWQTGSGTQTNMNVNEVLSNIANYNRGKKLGSKLPVHPNDHVNMCQSSNDVFPSAMNVAIVIGLKNQLEPALCRLRTTLLDKILQFGDVIKVGRTHLQDAVPMTVGQELSGYVAQLDIALHQTEYLVKLVAQSLAIGGTAVGTGLNSVEGFDKLVCERLTVHVSEIMGVKQVQFSPNRNKYAALAAHDELQRVNAELNSIATALMRLANDFRLLGSGPRCGIGEYLLPSNEPGSSIMPGKVNPTQCEALSMVCCQVIGNCVSVTMGAALGQLELNVYKPMIAYNLLHSITLLSEASLSFAEHCVLDLQLNRREINKYVQNNIMVATALNPHIGYDKAAEVAKYAYEKHCSLKEAAVEMLIAQPKELDQWLDSKHMLKPSSNGLV